MAKVLTLAAALVAAVPALAHDQWADGSPVPAWVKGACCGPQDVHHLKPEQVSRNKAGDYVLDVYPDPIPAKTALPSQDGDYWVFFGDYRATGGAVTAVRCFFVPLSF